MPKFLPTPGHYHYKVSGEQQVIIFTSVKSVLFLFMPPYFFVSQSSIAEEVFSSAPTVSNFSRVVFALSKFSKFSHFHPLSAKNTFPIQNSTQAGN